jgi:hypothetical protein
MKTRNFLMLLVHFLVVCLCGKFIYDAWIDQAPVTFIVSVMAWIFMYVYFEKRLNHDIYASRLFSLLLALMFLSFSALLYLVQASHAGFIYVMDAIGFAFWILRALAYHDIVKSGLVEE